MPPRCTKATIGVASIDDQFARSGHNISGLSESVQWMVKFMVNSGT
jgi:hypothetical protein